MSVANFASLNELNEAHNTLEKAHSLHRGDFINAFSFLGKHTINNELAVVRCYIPGAKKVAICSENQQLALEKFQDTALFQLVVSHNKVAEPIKLDIDYGDCQVQRYHAYSFESSLDNEAMYLFNQGTLAHAYRHFGAHFVTQQGVKGTRFTVWAPNAKAVSVIGDFNHWDASCYPMRFHPASGVWEIFIGEDLSDKNYKYSLLTEHNQRIEKADPFALQMQLPPHTASRVASLPKAPAPISPINKFNQAISIYEVHLGSWRRNVEQGNGYLSYQQLAEQLIPYVLDLGFTHIQLMPISEFPFDGSWGYQPVGLYAPTSRFGDINEFAEFIRQIKAAGLGVLIDWVPGHFPNDPHGLAMFDGTHLYEHADKRQGYHPDWNTHIYNYDRAEVRSFLLSNATYWLTEFGIDGIRVDAVASMLYLDYSREEGQWVANCYGGRENLGAISLLQQINASVYGENPNIVTVAEESTAWPGVTKPTDQSGLGFGFKWNMGWMNDSLEYMKKDPIYRCHHHNEMTFSLVYAFSENYILPLSHDEVVHGKGSLINKMPGDDWQKFANLRAFYGFMWAHPGKKLLFMGGEFAQYDEWDHDKSLDWHLLNEAKHKGISNLIKALNTTYKTTPSLYEKDNSGEGFRWIDGGNADQSVFSFIRKSSSEPNVIAICNFTPEVHENFKLGVPKAKRYQLVLNTDDTQFGGSGVLVDNELPVIKEDNHGFEHSISLTLAPLATYYLVAK
ncbi:1,4-alpha-glucan branching protein GlgB [Pseudoalteromonas spongiae]|uniref:1,4-alpha-glucan branching protein GlgB n=1 Tax=Pseudoalteromonas spongiae TaxID=298657 RepID=UPI0037352CA1